jgi:hypothetical protein
LCPLLPSLLRTELSRTQGRKRKEGKEQGKEQKARRGEKKKRKKQAKINKNGESQGVAQFGSVSVLGTEGHRFKSCHLE